MGGKVVAPFQYDGTTDSDLVEGWFENHLLPALPKGTTIPIDSASFHRKDILCDMAEDAGCHLITCAFLRRFVAAVYCGGLSPNTIGLTFI